MLLGIHRAHSWAQANELAQSQASCALSGPLLDCVTNENCCSIDRGQGICQGGKVGVPIMYHGNFFKLSCTIEK